MCCLDSKFSKLRWCECKLTQLWCKYLYHGESWLENEIFLIIDVFRMWWGVGMSCIDAVGSFNLVNIYKGLSSFEGWLAKHCIEPKSPDGSFDLGSTLLRILFFATFSMGGQLLKSRKCWSYSDLVRAVLDRSHLNSTRSLSVVPCSLLSWPVKLGRCKNKKTMSRL